MKKLGIVVGAFILMSGNVFAPFYSIKSQRELDSKLRDYQYSCVCFAHDDDTGQRIKSMMLSLTNSLNFNDDNFAILFVHADRDSLQLAAKKYKYVGIPLFVLLHHDQLLAINDLGGHYSIAGIKNFIRENMHEKLIFIDDYGYLGDDEYEKKRTAKEMMQSGYQPIDLKPDKKKDFEYFWNRGHGSTDCGRGGARYRKNLKERKRGDEL